jgi:pseudaminic acid synthase
MPPAIILPVILYFQISLMVIRLIVIEDKVIGPGQPVYIVAEMSANHGHELDQAIKIIYAAKEAGADAIKIQTYTPDTITINCDNEYFRIGKGTVWAGRTLHELYAEAHTPWDWQPKLKKIADDIGMGFFSSPFDCSAVDFLEKMAVPAYKIASFEIVDLPLIRRVARTGKPIILSTGMATLDEIGEAVKTAREEGATQIALLKCTSAYPALPEEMNLRTIEHLGKTFQVPVGLSDHSLEAVLPVIAVAMGACIIEKHLTLSRSLPGPDNSFSLEPHEFKAMVDAVRAAEKAIGEVSYAVTQHESASSVFRRSLFVVKDMRSGDIFDEENVRSIRPGYGLHTRRLREIVGKACSRDIPRGTPLAEDMIV